MSTPVICFGQQPCGFFPRRFLYAKITTARRLREELGGEIVFFLHDSDHDPRETATILKDRHTGREDTLNFEYANKLQRHFSPLFAKRILPEWKIKIARQLPCYVGPQAVGYFKATASMTAAEFCLEMYRRMGLMDGVRVERSGDPDFRRRAVAVEDYFVDVTHEGELVRARARDGKLLLHKGGDSYIELPAQSHDASQVSPTRDSRLRWMQSVIRCTHYIAGAGEMKYLHQHEAPDVKFVPRDFIEQSDRAYVPPE
ncbi:hypothetical protein AYO41_01345 [Verrucomicrobia bacterium SCGC AG-212-E04]|nr:hypothetical protein AYO41_01345 [Verrucomicrobia bacterium SCGC AG-212-E04]